MGGAPEAVGRYVVHDAIAAGGMATVHLGRLLGPSGFSRTVAIKRLHPHLAKDPEFLEMLLEEARLAARVRHPNVVSTLDLVEAESELFLVMEYVHGESLSRLAYAMRARGERVPVAVAGTIMAGVLAGLHAAHETRSDRGEPLLIVHRDVSPQNILVGVDGVTRLADFGVAKAAMRQKNTLQGQLKGKYAYMAPEQLMLEPIDRRADVFAAAVVFWELLTGARLFDAPEPSESLEKILLQPIPSPRALVPDLSAQIEAVVLKGLEREPGARFGTAREMAVALEGTLAGASARAVGEWVERTAGDALKARGVRVAKIERDAREIDPVAQPSIGHRRLSLAEAPTQVTLSLALERPEAPLPDASGAGTGAVVTRSGRPWLAAIAASAVLLLVATIGALRTAKRETPLTPAAQAHLETPADSASVPVPTITAAPPLPSSSVMSPTAPPHVSTRPVSQVHQAPRRAPGCQPSFYVDEQGIKHFKPECVR